MPAYGAARNEAAKKGKKVLDHLRVHEAENGGHMVEHHFESMEHPPEQHVFGEGQGGEMMDHIREHMGIEAEPEKHDIEMAEGSDKHDIDE